MNFKIISAAEFIGYKTDKNGKKLWQGAAPAILEINKIRFFSLAPKDKQNEEEINKTLNSFIQELTILFQNK